jgi:CheY-like chemotaxis protein
MVMPAGMTGLELAEQLRSLKPDLKVILCSGYSTELTEEGMPTEAGIVYLAKPYPAPVLAAAIHDCLDAQSPSPVPSP